MQARGLRNRFPCWFLMFMWNVLQAANNLTVILTDWKRYIFPRAWINSFGGKLLKWTGCYKTFFMTAGKEMIPFLPHILTWKIINSHFKLSCYSWGSRCLLLIGAVLFIWCGPWVSLHYLKYKTHSAGDCLPHNSYSIWINTVENHREEDPALVDLYGKH